MSRESRRAAGIMLILMPTVVFGGVSILSLLAMIYLAYLGAGTLAAELLVLGVGLIWSGAR